MCAAWGGGCFGRYFYDGVVVGELKADLVFVLYFVARRRGLLWQYCTVVVITSCDMARFVQIYDSCTLLLLHESRGDVGGINQLVPRWLSLPDQIVSQNCVDPSFVRRLSNVLE